MWPVRATDLMTPEKEYVRHKGAEKWNYGAACALFVHWGSLSKERFAVLARVRGRDNRKPPSVYAKKNEIGTN